MAWDPCASCGKNFHGSTSFTYVSWHQGETRYSYRLRQCLECCSELRNSVLAAADYRDASDNWLRADGQPMTAGHRAAPPAANGHGR